MYSAYRSHGILPHEIYNLPKGQKLFIYACQDLELDEIEKAVKAKNGH